MSAPLTGNEFDRAMQYKAQKEANTCGCSPCIVERCREWARSVAYRTEGATSTVERAINAEAHVIASGTPGTLTRIEEVVNSLWQDHVSTRKRLTLDEQRDLWLSLDAALKKARGLV